MVKFKKSDYLKSKTNRIIILILKKYLKGIIDECILYIDRDNISYQLSSHYFSTFTI